MTLDARQLTTSPHGPTRLPYVPWPHCNRLLGGLSPGAGLRALYNGIYVDCHCQSSAGHESRALYNGLCVDCHRQCSGGHDQTTDVMPGSCSCHFYTVFWLWYINFYLTMGTRCHTVPEVGVNPYCGRCGLQQHALGIVLCMSSLLHFAFSSAPLLPSQHAPIAKSCR